MLTLLENMSPHAHLDYQNVGYMQKNTFAYMFLSHHGLKGKSCVKGDFASHSPMGFDEWNALYMSCIVSNKVFTTSLALIFALISWKSL